MTRLWSVPLHAQRSHGAQYLSVLGSASTTRLIEIINGTRTEGTTNALHVENTERRVKIGPLSQRKAHWSYHTCEFSVHACMFTQFAAFYPHASTQTKLARRLAVVASWSNADGKAASTDFNLTRTHDLTTDHWWANRMNISDKLSTMVYGPLFHWLAMNFRHGPTIDYTSSGVGDYSCGFIPNNADLFTAVPRPSKSRQTVSPTKASAQDALYSRPPSLWNTVRHSFSLSYLEGNLAPPSMEVFGLLIWKFLPLVPTVVDSCSAGDHAEQCRAMWSTFSCFYLSYRLALRWADDNPQKPPAIKMETSSRFQPILSKQ